MRRRLLHGGMLRCLRIERGVPRHVGNRRSAGRTNGLLMTQATPFVDHSVSPWYSRSHGRDAGARVVPRRVGQSMAHPAPLAPAGSGGQALAARHGGRHGPLRTGRGAPAAQSLQLESAVLARFGAGAGGPAPSFADPRAARGRGLPDLPFRVPTQSNSARSLFARGETGGGGGRRASAPDRKS